MPGVLDPSRDFLFAERVHGAADRPVVLGHHPVQARVDNGDVSLIMLAGDCEIEVAPVGGFGEQFPAVRPKAGQRIDPAKLEFRLSYWLRPGELTFARVQDPGPVGERDINSLLPQR